MKKLFLLVCVSALLCLIFSPVMVMAKNEGKINKEIDLPIEKPKIKDVPKEEDDDGPTFYGEDIDSESDSIVFVIDCSCSMSGSRISKAKQELQKAISGLTKNFKFSIVSYTCSVSVWKNKLLDATDANKSAGKGYAGGLGASGATGTGPAVKTALGIDRNCKLVVLLTDGAPNCIGSSWGGNSDHLNMILSSNSQKAKIDVFAVQPWSGSYKQFCQDIAQKTGGRYKEVN